MLGCYVLVCFWLWCDFKWLNYTTNLVRWILWILFILSIQLYLYGNIIYGYQDKRQSLDAEIVSDVPALPDYKLCKTGPDEFVFNSCS